MKNSGEPLSLPGYEGKIHPCFNLPSLREVLSSGSRLLDEPGVRFLESARNRIAAVSLPGPENSRKDCIVKEFRPRGIDKLKSAFLPSKALKAWRGSWALIQAGIDTPLPVAFLEMRSRFFLDHALFLAAAVPEADEVRTLLRSLQGESLAALVQGLANLAHKCHSSGILHRDLSDGNVLVRRSDQETGFDPAVFVVLDTNRVRFQRRIGRIRGIKNLIRLGIPRAHQRGFLQAYLRPKKWSGTLWMWYRAHKTVFSSYMTLKSRLRIREIVRKLKIQ